MSLKYPLAFLLTALNLIFALSAAVPEKSDAASSAEFPEHLVFGTPCDSDLLLSRRGFSLGYSRKRKHWKQICDV